MSRLGISYWNVHGHVSKCVGDKLCDPEFLSLLEGTDIIGLGELHAEREVSVPGFISIKQKIRTKNFWDLKLPGV